MKEQLVSFETAKLAQERGFNEDVYYEYLEIDDDKFILHTTEEIDELDIFMGIGDNLLTKVPTQSFLQKWLREKCEIAVFVNLSDSKYSKYYPFMKRISNNYLIISEVIYYSSYEEALEKGLYEALKLINS